MRATAPSRCAALNWRRRRSTEPAASAAARSILRPVTARVRPVEGVSATRRLIDQDQVDFIIGDEKIRMAGKVAGTLVTSDELPFWLERGVRYFYLHPIRFTALDWQMSGRCLDGNSARMEKPRVAFELFNLVGKRALVTGSSQGIGLALARGLAEHGASVILNGRDRTKLDAAAANLTSSGHE